MAKIELILPKMGESVAEATVTSWLKKEGDFVELEEGILEIATDKVDSEVPSDYEGTLVKKLYKEGDVVKIGSPFAIIEIKGELKKESEKESPIPSAYDEPIQVDLQKKEQSIINKYSRKSHT
jgi:2-oxoglutarate dehydrogenase E2 component (dihydrolipoamide succinyltransferase)